MKYLLYLVLLGLVLPVMGQKSPVPIKGVESLLIIGKIDKPDDRYAVEVNLTKFFAQFGMNVKPSLNYSKVGNSVDDLGSDSLNQVLKIKGIKGYLLISVRGFDRKFKPRENFPVTLTEALEEGHLYPIFQEEMSSVTFEFMYFEDGQFKGYDILRLSGTSSRAQVFEKLQKKLEKKLPGWAEKPQQ